MENSLTGKPLYGRTALITGGSRGIGRAIALRFAEAGCAVAINYLHAKDDAEEAVNLITAQDGKAISVQADVSREGDVQHLISASEEALGPIDILVNNAGILHRVPLEELDLAEWNYTIQVNLTSSFLTSQAVIPGMRRRKWGRLIFLSSIAAQTGGVVGPHYASSKAGMLGLMHSYASLLVKEGITSNAIAPALIDTDMIRKGTAVRPDLIPMGRFGTSDEIAQAALFLATTEYVTGQTINLNGGWYPS